MTNPATVASASTDSWSWRLDGTPSHFPGEEQEAEGSPADPDRHAQQRRSRRVEVGEAAGVGVRGEVVDAQRLGVTGGRVEQPASLGPLTDPVDPGLVHAVRDELREPAVVTDDPEDPVAGSGQLARRPDDPRRARCACPGPRRSRRRRGAAPTRWRRGPSGSRPAPRARGSPAGRRQGAPRGLGDPCGHSASQRALTVRCTRDSFCRVQSLPSARPVSDSHRIRR